MTATTTATETTATATVTERATCLCGCGATPAGKGGRFLPGHDGRLKGRLLATARDPKASAEDRALAVLTLEKHGWGHFLIVTAKDKKREQVAARKAERQLAEQAAKAAKAEREAAQAAAPPPPPPPPPPEDEEEAKAPANALERKAARKARREAGIGLARMGFVS